MKQRMLMLIALFSIDPATGQSEDQGSSGLRAYRPTTLSRSTWQTRRRSLVTLAMATITVIVRVLQTNDEPEIDGASTIEHVEGGTALGTDLSDADTPPTNDVARYDATDEDPTDTTLDLLTGRGGQGSVQAQGYHSRRGG